MSYETNENIFEKKFWEHAWADFFEDFSQPEYWKNAPGAAAQVDLSLDDDGKIIAIDGRPHVQMMLKKVLVQKDRKEGETVRFSLLKSTVVPKVLKQYDLHSLHQSAIENVRWAHRQKEDAVDIPVPPLLLAALIQYWQTTEANNSKLAQQMEEIARTFDEHTSPGVMADGHKSTFRPKLVVRSETGRMSSQEPNEANKPGWRRGNFTHISSESGRVTHKKPFVEQIEKGEKDD